MKNEIMKAVTFALI